MDFRGMIHNLSAYAAVLARETGQPAIEPVKLIAPMLERFIATDRGFAQAQRQSRSRVAALVECAP
ncbi:MAG: DUF2274 domain-containing protein [Rhizobiales bacterium]|nr:DUF2274 domain-containing protein [Hyphomicrobiales bacterium]